MSSLNEHEQTLLALAATLADDGDAAFVRAIAHFIARLDALAQFLDDTVQELKFPHHAEIQGQPQNRSLN
jgi:hypothetical protein